VGDISASKRVGNTIKLSMFVFRASVKIRARLFLTSNHEEDGKRIRDNNHGF